MKKYLPLVFKILFYTGEWFFSNRKLISKDNQNNTKLNTKSQCHLFKLQIKTRRMSSWLLLYTVIIIRSLENRLKQNQEKFWKRNNKLLEYIWKNTRTVSSLQPNHIYTIVINILHFWNTLNSFYILMNFYSNPPCTKHTKPALLSNREKQTQTEY